MLIGNLTRDPEMRYTPQGTAVCTFGVATNRSWTVDGEKKEDVEFHNVVAWNKLAEICAQLLKKGRKVYVEGRLSTRSWQGTDGAQKQRTEVVISDMVILDKKSDFPEEGEMAIPDAGIEIPEAVPEPRQTKAGDSDAKAKAVKGKKKEDKKEEVEEPAEEDIPF
ncbi:MAG: Single-stranded DNA-binding protein [Candidatus Woesebacteria bacterium GW2011_GWB1_44_11]|nr:MAG: Single-stranded DNA-binding protein [Candidatus Woesebacteria bacterium GW2011_GWB1_44_11]KKT54755.1 MAG: Single-stranded DNA-binding protein [Candidatus Woesebacteria bacterium GW2011_GWA1_44_23]